MKDENYYLAKANYYLARALLKDGQQEEPKINSVSDTVQPTFEYAGICQWDLWGGETNSVWNNSGRVFVELTDRVTKLTPKEARELARSLCAAAVKAEKENNK